jgi:hypothetical protein
VLLQHAAEMEVERDHALDRSPGDDDGIFAPEDALLAAANRAQDGPAGDDLEFEALEAEATFDRVLFDGGEFGTQAALGSDEEADYLGLPGLLEPDQVATLLQARQSAHRETRSRKSATAAAAAAHRAVPALRKELNGMVAAWHHRTGIPHGAVHTELRQACGGPLAAQASAEQLQARIDLIRAWALRRR